MALALPVVDVTNATAPDGSAIPGLAVTEAANGAGLPIGISGNGYGQPVIYVGSGGLPVVTDSPVGFLGSDLIAYWDAARSDLMTLGGGNAVSSWRDIVAGYDATQGTGAAQPIWSATSFNGAPGLSFDGTDDNLTCTGAALLAALPMGATPSELWLVASQDAAAGDTTVRRGFGYGGANEATARTIARSVSGGINRARAIVGDGAAATNVTASAVDLSTRHVIRWAVGAAAQTLFVDGQSVGSAAITPGTTAARLRLGSLPSSSPGFYWQGQFAVAIITKSLDAAKAAALQSYLMSRRRV